MSSHEIHFTTVGQRLSDLIGPAYRGLVPEKPTDAHGYGRLKSIRVSPSRFPLSAATILQMETIVDEELWPNSFDGTYDTAQAHEARRRSSELDAHREYLLRLGAARTREQPQTSLINGPVPRCLDCDE